MRLSNKDQ